MLIVMNLRSSTVQMFTVTCYLLIDLVNADCCLLSGFGDFSRFQIYLLRMGVRLRWLFSWFYSALIRYLRVQTTSLPSLSFTFIKAIISFSPNSRIMVDFGSPPWFWVNLLPSSVITLFTSRSSNVVSSNSLPNSNSISVSLNVDVVINLYRLFGNLRNSTVGETVFPMRRRNQPTPE